MIHLNTNVGPWCISENAASSIFSSRARFRISLDARSYDPSVEFGSPELDVVDGIAVVSVSGVLAAHPSPFFHELSLPKLKRTFDRLRVDDSIRGVVVSFDSPGGTVAQTNETATALRKLSQVKPSIAFCNDLTASAAYWIASQCTRIEANDTALVGSIGTYGVMVDSSEGYRNAGVAVHIVRAGEFKGMGTPGTAIEDKHLAHTQHIVDAVNKFFLAAVQQGRGFSQQQLDRVSDGRVHIAAEAKRLGLIDEVESFESAFDRFAESIK